MRTTIYINRVHVNKLDNASSLMNISRNELISIFISKLTHDDGFSAKLFKTVTYQDSRPYTDWITMHVNFEPVFYEKALDLRRHFKFSVSWFIAYAIMNYLDDIVEKYLNPKRRERIRDNYDRKYTYRAKKNENIHSFITIWGIPKRKNLQRLL